MGRKSSIKKIQRNNTQSKDIQAALMMDLYLKGYSPIVANYTGRGLSECDILAISKADLIYEFEIKISRSDFKKDFTKEHKHKVLENRKATQKSWRWKDGEKVNEQTWFQIPNYFTYLCPAGMIKPEEVPEYAGLLYISEDCTTFEWIKKSPKLHDVRADLTLIRSISHNLTCKFIFGGSFMNYMKKRNEELLDEYIRKEESQVNEEDNVIPDVLSERGGEILPGGAEGTPEEGPGTIDPPEEGL